MAVAITIPRLGWNMDQGVFVGWLKGPGEPVQAGEPLFTLEGEKAAQDVESIESGTLHIAADAPEAGSIVAVGVIIGHLLAPGESAPNGDTRDQAAAPAAAAMPAGLEGLGSTRAPAPAARASRRGDRPRSSPLARRLARELGVDWTRLAGSGSTGRIRKVDVLAAASAAQTRPSRDLPPIEGTTVPVGPTRATIAARLVRSRQTTVPVTLHTTADATNLVGLRAQYRAAVAAPAGKEPPGYLEVLIKLAALTLRDHPRLHAAWADDRLIVPAEANIGFAVDTEEGLVVPVIRGAASLSLGEIVARARDLARRARERRIRPDEMQGGTFTITNLGAFGIESFTPVINPPECAVLGMGRIVRQPVMIDDRAVGRDRMSLSLTFDHRIVDGAPAARFLQSLVASVENPGPWLIA
ncbi:MAG: dihydrolipoamide acetyltransferase family protein [Isosphaeraceae bacterium]